MAPLMPNPRKGITKVENKPNSQFLAIFASKKLVPSKRPINSTPKPASTLNKTASDTAGTDAALAALKNSLASENAKKAENT